MEALRPDKSCYLTSSVSKLEASTGFFEMGMGIGWVLAPLTVDILTTEGLFGNIWEWLKSYGWSCPTACPSTEGLWLGPPA